mgnify:CR=1 FL=1
MTCARLTNSSGSKRTYDSTMPEDSRCQSGPEIIRVWLCVRQKSKPVGFLKKYFAAFFRPALDRGSEDVVQCPLPHPLISVFSSLWSISKNFRIAVMIIFSDELFIRCCYYCRRRSEISPLQQHSSIFL